MASGRVHKKVNNMVALITAISVTILYFNGYVTDIQLILWFTIGLIFGYLLGPDLDLEGLNIQEYDIANSLKHTMSWIDPNNKQFVRKCLNFWLYGVKLWWFPYALLIPHRSPFSHLPVLSDVIRIVYFIFSLAVIISGCYVFSLSIGYAVGLVSNIDPLFNEMVEINLKIFWLVFDTEYLQEKVSIVLGSSVMTFSHLMMDSFRIRW